MLELLFLLLPVAAGYGWIMGRNSSKQTAFKSKASLSKEYSAGLNFLLSDQEEKAVEHLINFLEVNADTLETHLALANLFRKRGEIDKAIEIHEHLNRLQLSDLYGQKVKQELARDYISAGMLDRAEQVLVNIQLSKENKDDVLLMLVGIYQTMKEWHKSDELCVKQKNRSKRLNCTLSHHCCELAEQNSSNDSVVKWYKKALRYDDGCVRALLALAQIEQKGTNYAKAIDQYHEILRKDPCYLPLVLEQIEQCFIANDDKQGFYDYLRHRLQQDLQQTHSTGQDKPPSRQKPVTDVSCVSFTIKYSEYLEYYEGADQALAYILNSLTLKPNIRAFAQLLDLESKNCDSEQAAQQFTQVKGLVTNYLASKPLYECRQCGFSTKLHYWLCPSCQTWGTSKPAMGLVGL